MKAKSGLARFLWIVSCVCVSLGLSAAANATVIETDGSLGSAEMINGQANVYTIEENLGTLVGGAAGAGGNLFHSFHRFDIAVGDTARFTASSTPANVISRVTGGFASLLDGSFESDIAGADFYFLNPAGVVIGSQGVFDLPGSLFLSSAAGLVFEDGVFDSSSQETPFVSSSPGVECCGGGPTALSFELGPRGDIEFNGGTRRWKDGSIVQVVGADIRLLAGTKMIVPGGEFHLAAVGQAAVDVPLAFIADADLMGNGSGGGTVELRGSMGANRTTTDLAADGGVASNGRVVLRGGHLILETTSIRAGGRDGGRTAIDLVAQGSIVISDSKIFGRETREASVPSHLGIRLVAPDISLDGGSEINSASSGFSAGSIELLAEESLRLTGERTSIHARLLNEDAGGGIHLVAGSLVLEDGAAIYTEALPKFGFSPSGPGGKIQVDADRLRLDGGARIYTNTLAASASGAIELSISDSLRLSEVSQIYTEAGRPVPEGDAVSATGPAGNIRVSTGEAVLEGASNIRSTTHSAGKSGDIDLAANGLVSLSDESQIYTEASGSTAAMTGRAGDLRVVAEDISAVGASNFRSTTLTGAATGAVELTARSGLTLSGLSGIATQPLGSGDAGTIRVEAGSAVLDQGGTIISEAGMEQGSPGSVTLVVAGPIRVSGVGVNSEGENSPSQISTRVVNADSESDAGDISIRAGSLELLDGGLVSARTKTAPSFGFGNAGDIVIELDSLLRVSGEHILPGPDGLGLSSEISARGAGGEGGQIDITASTVEISDTGRISAANFGESNSGSVSVDAADTISMVNGTIFTESGRREGGNITLNAGNLISLVNSTLETEVSSSQGGAGEINLGQTTEPSRIVLNSSSLISNAAAGEAGDITISAGYLIKSTDTVIDAASDNASLNGTIRINALEQELSGRLVPLELAYLDVSSLLLPPCAARADADRSSLTVRGRPGVASDPAGMLPSPILSGEMVSGADAGSFASAGLLGDAGGSIRLAQATSGSSFWSPGPSLVGAPGCRDDWPRSPGR